MFETAGIKIKLLILVPTLECGGMEKYVSLFCNNINTNDFEVTLVVLNNANPFFFVQNKAVKVVDLHVHHVRYAIFKILAVIKKSKPDIVYSTGNHLNLYLAIFRKFINSKIIVIARETSIVSINNRRAKFVWLYDSLVKIFYANLDFVISQSVFMEKDLINNYNIKSHKSIVIYNPVEEPLTKYQASVSSNQLLPKFITVARLSEEKGIDRLIDSVALLKQPFVYYLIGEGNLHVSLQQRINNLQLQDKVFLSGRKNNPFAGMEDASVFLMGSRYEGLGNVLLEAGSRGIPVIAFDAPGGINEIIIDGENGFLVKDNDEKAFSLAIEKALVTNFNRQQIITNTQKRFSVNAIIKKTEDLFLQLYQKSKMK